MALGGHAPQELCWMASCCGRHGATDLVADVRIMLVAERLALPEQLEQRPWRLSTQALGHA